MNPQPVKPDRRRFLAWASASAAFFAAHGFAAENPERKPPSKSDVTDPRILSLELVSSAPLTEVKAFYHESLGLSVLEDQRERLTIAAGSTRLTFTSAKKDDEKPFYHFAFNIPENKILSAWKWQRERTPLLPIPARLRDPKFPDDIVDYRHWNAHSVFFLDPAGNVVEYIARHDLNNAAAGEFDTQDILYASEIGLIVDDVPATALKLQEVVGLEPYIGASEQFTAIGDEHGLLLVMKRGRILNFNPASDEKAARVFRTGVSVRGVEPATYRLPAFPYEVLVKA